MFQPKGGDGGDVTATKKEAGEARAACDSASEAKSLRDQERQAAAAAANIHTNHHHTATAY